MVRLPLHVPEQGETDVRRNNAKRRGGQNGVNLKADGTSSGRSIGPKRHHEPGKSVLIVHEERGWSAWPGLKKYGLKEGDAENPFALVGQTKTWSLSEHPVNEQLAGIVREAQRTRLTAQWAAVNRRLMIAVRGGEWLEVGGRKGRMLEECLGRGEERAIRNLGIGKDEKIWCVLESKRREESRNHSQGDRRVYTNSDRLLRAPFRCVAGEPWIGPQWPWLAIVLWASVAIVGRRRHAVEWLLRKVSTAAHRPSPTQQARMETDREAGRTRELGEGTSGDWRGSCLDSDRLDWSNTDASPHRIDRAPFLYCFVNALCDPSIPVVIPLQGPSGRSCCASMREGTQEIENLAVALLGYWTAPPVLMMTILTTFLSGADVRSTWLQRQPTGTLPPSTLMVFFLGSVQLDRIKNAIRAGGKVFQGRHSATLGTILDEISVFLTSRPTAEVN
ncbi:uncharacterized protein BO96DRAFT_434454 [Aspergillus niger CBS 101883]|uniref:uncharacterized protein n=1 Tax=Aspergillus lacticoffeatus (strain CBS 101883) TaxID=1450533 RepID=UPI000D7F58D6|nr:uncharacterized protein BO96DRAFT_434454 [Aspergillus niger CBS 101883]PYH56476.1 hypothetical protein BO96DRAFT_434454 [Aspergillus niger CBS 101883]